MDIFVDTDALSEEMNGLLRTIQDVASSVSIMKSCLTIAEKDFDTANFDRVFGSVQIVADALNQMEINLEQTREYLSKLIDHIEGYNNLKY